MGAALAAALLLVSASAPASPPSRIVFASARTGVAQLYSVEPSGAGLAQLTFGSGNWGFPVPSPDGRFVLAFRGPELWLQYPGDLVAGPRQELWLMRADGRGARLVGHADSVSWSGDSRRFAVGFYNAIWTMAVASERPRRVLLGDGASSPSLSPDGRSLAYTRSGESGSMLVVRRNGRTRVVARGVGGRSVWSPDGKLIAVRGRDTVSVVRATGGVVKSYSAVPAVCLVGCIPPGFAWSPDSRLLAYGDAEGIKLVAPPGGTPQLLGHYGGRGLAWSPRGDAIAFDTRAGVGIATLDGQTGPLVRFGPGDFQPGVGWSLGRTGLPYQTPEETPLLVRVAARELQARVPIQHFSADGDRVAYWLCPHSLGAWRPGDAQPVALGPARLAACLLPRYDRMPGNYVYNLALAGERLAYFTTGGGNTTLWQLWLTSLERGDEGIEVDGGSRTAGGTVVPIGDVLGSGSALVYGARNRGGTTPSTPQSIWRLDGAAPVEIARRPYDLQPLAVEDGRVVARHPDGSLELLDLLGGVLRTLDVPALGAALAGDDLVVLVHGQLRDYSASTGELLHAWPLPDVPSAGRCRLEYCPPVRLTLDDAARGLALYTLDGAVHLLRLRDGSHATVPGATVAELTDAGLFYTYPGEKPWPGRIRFVPFAELPL